MTVNTATPQDTFDHLFGSGATSYEWWHAVEITGVNLTTYDVTPEWSAEVTADNGDDGETTVTVNHAVVLNAARKVLANPPKYAGDALMRESRNLVFNADDTDFDADSADQLLQFIVLGEIVFG